MIMKKDSNTPISNKKKYFSEKISSVFEIFTENRGRIPYFKEMETKNGSQENGKGLVPLSSQ